MIPIGILLLFGGYAVSSYGWVLLSGRNITLREWFSPLTPFDWVKDPGSGSIPPGQLFPGGKASKSGGKQAKQPGAPPPGQQGPHVPYNPGQ